MAEQQQDKKITFKSVQIFKDQTLGIGSYGKVCRAKCDDLPCAAKLIHETLLYPTAQQPMVPQRAEYRLPMSRFEQECEFLSTIRHPNIVQYLSIYRDPDTGLPVLLMELMDKNLTYFLEISPQPIPYHIQVNICHDITLALSFLHSNNIIHRDLSSNNVLLISNVRAKVTDFGMTRLHDQNQQATQLTFTLAPGTDVYMPPEAVEDKPVYTEKIDCFSFGVLILQILTRQFPKPGDRQVTLNDPRYPQGSVKLCVPEIERRQNHISEIDPNHPLLPVALNCLKDRDVERLSAQQLCERVAALKNDSQYSEDLKAVERHTAELGGYEELRSARQEIQSLQQVVRSQRNQLDRTVAENLQSIMKKDQVILEKEQELQQNGKQLARLEQQVDQLSRENSLLVEENKQQERNVRSLQQLLHVKREKNENEQREVEYYNISQPPIAKAKQAIDQAERLSGQLEPKRPTSTGGELQINESRMKLTWRKGDKAPRRIRSSFSAAVKDHMLYLIADKSVGYSFSLDTAA